MSKQYCTISPAEVYKALQTSEDGLAKDEIQKRQSEFGLNSLPQEKSFSLWLLLFQQFKSALIYILLIAAVISLFLKDYVNMYVILAAVGLNVLVGFVQEFRAQKALEKLRKVVTQYALVKRGGHEKQIETKELVPGDVVILEAGQKVPADIRLVKATDLQISEASLTGESVAVDKISDTLPSAVILAEQKNMVFLGTTVVAGKGEGVVVATGKDTEIGKIAELIKSTPQDKTGLQMKLEALGKSLGIIILVLSFVIFLAGILLKYDFRDMFTTAVAIAVAAIPEGLVVVMTVILAIGMQRILKQKALVRKLIAAETLGSTTVICTDKTGTLTEGEMRVVRIITHDQTLDTARQSLVPDHGQRGSAQSYFLALKIGVLASDAYIENPEAALTHRVVIGMPTEKALVLAASEAGISIDDLRKDNSREEVIPFDSEKKYMASLHTTTTKQHIIYCKGAPEVLLQKATKVDLDGSIKKLDSHRRSSFQKEFEKLSSEGLRILALGFKEVDKEYCHMKEDEGVLDDLIFVGFVGIKDPLRKETVETMNVCRQAGIRPVMLTGDHRLTAQAIAKELDLPHEDKNIIEGAAFEKLNEEELKKRITEISVYARVNPRDKLRIIDAWQERGDVVAMTGDGVNDAPALKSADIGVALGSGTDVAKETADMVLLDNNFKTIVKAVEQGRIIYENIKKVVLYLMSDGFTEMIIIAVAVVFRWELPILAAQILWVNLISDGFPNIALTVEKGDKDIMDREPVPRKRSILDGEIKSLIIIISTLSAILSLGIFWWSLNATGDIDMARTMTFAAVGVNSLLYVFSCRSTRKFIWQRKMFNNPYLVIAVMLGFLLQISAIYLPFFQSIFHTVNLGINDWLIVLSVGIIDILAIELTKWFFIHRQRQNSKKRQTAVVSA